MSAPKEVVAIFDVGKTNKKLLLLDQQYGLVYEESTQPAEIKDEDGFHCEDVYALTAWIKSSLDRLLQNDEFAVRGINFSGYGASFVYLDDNGEVMLPLYNYLKPYPSALQQKLYDEYGGADILARQTASPVLGSLNSGLQLYRLQQEKPEVFAKIKWALHLPQYLAYVLSGGIYTDITSIGCHTHLWDFQNNKYHEWVSKEKIDRVLAPLVSADTLAGHYKNVPVGIGLHDSSAALLPYLATFSEPFVLLSTGTWCISLNPFNQAPLTNNELDQDCLCYLSYDGHPVKASRLFAGYEHEQEVKRIAQFFATAGDHYKQLRYDASLTGSPNVSENNGSGVQAMVSKSAFSTRRIENFGSYEEAYHQLMADIIVQQVQSTNLVLKGTAVGKIFVDGGFSKNEIYMSLLTRSFPKMEVFAASLPQASAIGAALAIHRHWNKQPKPRQLVTLEAYHPKEESTR